MRLSNPLTEKLLELRPAVIPHLRLSYAFMPEMPATNNATNAKNFFMLVKI